MIPVHFGTLPPIYPPQISTRDVTEISAYSATCGGNILSDGGKEILTSGICWSTSSIPTIEDFKTTDGTKRFSFRSTMTNLVPGTKYYVRAYGALYNWPAALTACPSGWHLPSDEEWKQLEGYLGLPIEEFDNIGFRGSEQGIQLKSPAGWTDDVSGTNSSGFTAIPAGYRFTTFEWMGAGLAWWTSTAASEENAWDRGLSNQTNKIDRYAYGKNSGFSIRCVRD